jgi:hypothetical protein
VSKPVDPEDTGSRTTDDYRAAKIVIDQFGDRAEREALRHAGVLLNAGDHNGVSRWMQVLAAIQELRWATLDSDRQQ